MCRIATLWLLLGAAAAPAAERTFEVTVAAGKHDRTNVPVCVPVSLPAELANGSVVLRDPAGKTLPGQITVRGLLTTPASEPKRADDRALCFVLPSLKAGDTITLKATVSSAKTSGDAFAWAQKEGDFAELRFGNQPVLRYFCKTFDDSSTAKRNETFKVFHHLYSPDGKRLVTNGPGGKYPHHRGVFYGFMKCTLPNGKVVDTWHCKTDAKKGIDAYQTHEKYLLSEAGPVVGRHRVEVGWHGTGKDVFAREQRELTVYRVPGGTLLEFASRLTPTKGTVKVDGDPQHAGFHFRADNEVSDKTAKETYYLRPDGKDEKGKTRNWPQDKNHVNLPWNAMSFVLGSQRYTTAYLDRPSNPKEARFSERDYGRFGSYFVAECDEKNPLDVSYRLWLQEGEMTGDAVAALSAAFVDPVRVTVK